MKWISVEDQLPPEGEYVLIKYGPDDSAISISRLVDGEFDSDQRGARVSFRKKERFCTRSKWCEYWMYLPWEVPNEVD